MLHLLCALTTMFETVRNLTMKIVVYVHTRRATIPFTSIQKKKNRLLFVPNKIVKIAIMYQRSTTRLALSEFQIEFELFVSRTDLVVTIIVQ